MAISDRRLRERQERERLIIEHADDLLRQHGFLGLNLDELAERVEYSKATLYNHFDSKEDLVAAVDLRHLQKRAELFSRALTFQGLSRERMFVGGWADRIISLMYPHWSSLHQLIATDSFHDKVHAQRKEACGRVSGRCFQVAFEIITQARQSGDLPADAPPNPQILSGLISLSKGAHLLDENKSAFPPEAGIHPVEMLNENYHIYLDGVGWRPSRSQHDYTATEQRIQAEVFAEELASLSLARLS